MPLENSNLNALSSRFAQPALSRAAAGHPSGLFSDRIGRVVTDADDINQCLEVILTTRKGSEPHRPLFGCDALDYIDAPIDTARPHIVREVTDAIRQWEPRIHLLNVRVAADADTASRGAVVIRIEWRYANGVASQVFSANVSLAALGAMA